MIAEIERISATMMEATMKPITNQNIFMVVLVEPSPRQDSNLRFHTERAAS